MVLPSNSGVVRDSLADQVWRQLRRAIVSGELKPGDRLVELDIAEQMGTSQGPVREALQRLEQDGLVNRHSRSATYVTDVSTEDMYELSLVRKVVESLAIRRTSRAITPEQCDELDLLVEQMREAARAGDMPVLADFDMEFHRRICEWSDSTTLLRAWMPLYSQIQRFVVKTHPTIFSNLVEIADLHLPIVEALRQGQPDRAAEAMEQHIILIWQQLEPGRDWNEYG